MTSYNKILNNFLKILENKYIGTITGLFLVLYIELMKPKVPKFLKNLFKNNLFKLFYIFLSAYMFNKNIHVSLIIALLFSMYRIAAVQDDVVEHFTETISYIDRINNKKVPNHPVKVENVKNEHEAKLSWYHNALTHLINHIDTCSKPYAILDEIKERVTEEQYNREDITGEIQDEIQDYFTSLYDEFQEKEDITDATLTGIT